MKKWTAFLRHTALTNAAEFIRSHAESGWTQEDYEQAGMNIKDEKSYTNQCNIVYEKLEREADKLRKKYDL